MIRPILTEIAIFLIPFVAYALFLVASRSQLMVTSSWPIHVVGSLLGAALVLSLLVLMLLANVSGAPPGSTYTPAHLENGRLVPGSEK